MSGLLLVHKPAGMTSHDVVAAVRKLAGTRRVGHTGTLDPDATGLLPITLGVCTKLANFLILDEKVYRFALILGAQTTTDDASGEVMQEGDTSDVTAKALHAALAPYIGDIMQVPPRYSAIRVEGKRAYELARAGVAFELPARPVRIESIEVLSIDGPRAMMQMRCGSGTYVRSVARDLGEDLGCFGHADAIHRVRVGSFHLDDAVTLDQLGALTQERGTFPVEHLLTPAQMVASLPSVRLHDDMAKKWAMGQRVEPIEPLHESDSEAMIAVLSLKGELLGVGQVREDGERRTIAPKKVLHAI